MKKLEKLRLQNLEEISLTEKKSMKGGDGWVTINGVYGYCTDDAYATPGFLTSISNLQGMQDYYNEAANGSAIISMVTTVLSPATGPTVTFITSLFMGGTAYSFDSQADKLGEAIDVLQNSGYNSSDYSFRYYENDGIVKIFDILTGEVAAEYSF